MVKKNPEICPYCGHVILDDNQEYCDYCGSDIEKEEVQENRKSSGPCLGSIGTLLLIILIVFLLVMKK